LPEFEAVVQVSPTIDIDAADRLVTAQRVNFGEEGNRCLLD